MVGLRGREEFDNIQVFLRGESLEGMIDFPRGVREGVLKDRRRCTSAFGTRRVKSLGNLELGRRIKEDTAVRAVSVPCEGQ